MSLTAEWNVLLQVPPPAAPTLKQGLKQGLQNKLQKTHKMKKSKTDGCIIHSPQRLLEQYDLSYGQDSHGFEPVVYGGSPAKLPLGTDREQFVFFLVKKMKKAWALPGSIGTNKEESIFVNVL